MTEIPLPATLWDRTLAWLLAALYLTTGALAVSLFAAPALLWGLAPAAGTLLVTAVVMGHLSCECGGCLLKREYRVTREGERVRVCRDCAAGLPGSSYAAPDGSSPCCPHGIPWSGWPCMPCAYPHLFPEG